MILEEISKWLQRGKTGEVQALIQTALAGDISPHDILNESLIKGMSVIGEKFKKNEVYIPEVLIAARAMKMGMEILKPVLIKQGIEPIGKALICTVKGDLHDIGKNLVKMMLEGQGIECIDLGVNVASATVIEAVRTVKPDLVCLSALLSTTMMGQKEVIEALKAANLRDQVIVMVGGAPVTAAFAEAIGADGYSSDAASAAVLAKQLLTEGV
ncbi:MAG: corrinoid protein [Bacilli bacterium]|nr:corrinoid protein [Bacilli bacterium]